MHVWNVLHAARWKYSTQKWRKNRLLRIIAQLCRAIPSQLRHASTIGKNLNSNISSTCPHSMVNVGLLTSLGLVNISYISRVSCPLMEFWQVQNSLCVQILHSPIFAALLHRTRALGVSQALRRSAEGASRGCHLYSAGRPSRWASAYFLVYFKISS